MEALLSTMGALFFTGLAVGIGPCMLHVGPAVAFYITGTALDWKAGLKAALVFSLARLSAHLLLGALAGGIGMRVVIYLEREIAVGWVQLGATIFILFLGTLIIFGHNPRFRLCQHFNRHTVQNSTLSMAMLGFLLGIVPYCFPFLGVLTYIAFELRDIFLGAICGFAFGLGASLITPLLIIGPAAGIFPRLFKSPLVLEIMRRASGGILILFGITRLFMAMT